MSQFFFVLQRFSVTDRHSAVFKPEWDLLSVLLLHWTVSILCGVCVLPLSLRIPETPVSPCCSPHLAAVVFPYSARPKSPFQGVLFSNTGGGPCFCMQQVSGDPFSCVCQGCCNGLLPHSGLPLQVSMDDSAISLQCVTRPDRA